MPSLGPAKASHSRHQEQKPERKTTRLELPLGPLICVKVGRHCRRRVQHRPGENQQAEEAKQPPSGPWRSKSVERATDEDAMSLRFSRCLIDPLQIAKGN